MGLMEALCMYVTVVQIILFVGLLAMVAGLPLVFWLSLGNLFVVLDYLA